MNASSLSSLLHVLQKLCDTHGGPAMLGDILAAGPITKQPHTLPFRVVLRVIPSGEFVVHDQIWEFNRPLPLDVRFIVYGFDCGDYFSIDNLPAAVKRFAQRVAETVPGIQSLYRSESSE